GTRGIVALVLDREVDGPGPPARASRSHKRRGAFRERDDPAAGLDERDQFAEAPHPAAVDGLAAQSALMPGMTKLIRIKRVKVVTNLQQTAAEGALVGALPGVLLPQAGCLNALEVSGRHGSGPVRSGTLRGWPSRLPS